MPKKLLNIWFFIFFSSFAILLTNSPRNFLVSHFFGFDMSNIVGSSFYSKVESGVGSDVNSGFDADIGIKVFSRYFMGNILLLNLRIFSLALRNNSMLFWKDLLTSFFTFIYTL